MVFYIFFLPKVEHHQLNKPCVRYKYDIQTNDGGFEIIILSHLSTSKYLIPIEDYLQTFNEFKEVQIP